MICIGIITAMCLDTRQSCLTLGTSSGYHTCWDLRFRLPIATIAHSKGINFHLLIPNNLNKIELCLY
jgi:hypothetical protein